MSEGTPAKFVCANSQNSAELIGHNELIREKILLHLPINTLISFKLVSKQWRSLISSSDFVSRYNLLHPPSITGLFLVPKDQDEEENNQIEYISLNQNYKNPSIFHFSKIKILQSCNGLLLCFNETEHLYCVLNPTTHEKKILPKIPANNFPVSSFYYSLAFDPTISQHYKIVCLVETSYNMYKICVYSSESEHWMISKVPEFSAPLDIDFTIGVYCNGSVHWMKRTKIGLYFDVEKQVLNHMPRVPREEQYSCEYFGQSEGCLHCVFTMEGSKFYEVFEMKKDYSDWKFKYRIEMDVLEAQIPNMVMETNYRDPRFMYQCHVLSVFRSYGEFLEIILSIPGDVIAYDCKEKTSRHICKSRISARDKRIWYAIYDVYEFFESFSRVSLVNG